MRAAKLAGAHNFIEKLPQDYDTQVGESGGKLSGGQKQRISIARAIVKQPKLLILDEATAALDSHSEQAVSEALDSISEGVTTVAIAHRLATIRNYDQIVVMGAGKVLERGTHKELLAQRGYYYKLAAAQDTGAGGVDDGGSVDVESEDEDGASDAASHHDYEDADRRSERSITAIGKESRGRRRMADVVEDDENGEPATSSGDENGADSPSRDSSGQSTLLRNSSEDTRIAKTEAVLLTKMLPTTLMNPTIRHETKRKRSTNNSKKSRANTHRVLSPNESSGSSVANGLISSSDSSPRPSWEVPTLVKPFCSVMSFLDSTQSAKVLTVFVRQVKSLDSTFSSWR